MNTSDVNGHKSRPHEAIQRNQAFQQALDQYNDALMSFNADEQTQPALCEAQETAYQTAQTALYEAINAHCARQIAAALADVALKFPRPSEDVDAALRSYLLTLFQSGFTHLLLLYEAAAPSPVRVGTLFLTADGSRLYDAGEAYQEHLRKVMHPSAPPTEE